MNGGQKVEDCKAENDTKSGENLHFRCEKAFIFSNNGQNNLFVSN